MKILNENICFGCICEDYIFLLKIKPYIFNCLVFKQFHKSTLLRHLNKKKPLFVTTKDVLIINFKKNIH